MEGSRIQTNEKDVIYVYALDSSGVGVTGATITLSIRRQSDGFFWSGSGYSSSFAGLTMTETDSTNVPGAYHYEFTPRGPTATFLLNATTATAGVANAPWLGEIKAGGWADNVDSAISSRSSSSDMTEVLRRIGTSVVELDMRKLFGFCGQILTAARDRRR